MGFSVLVRNSFFTILFVFYFSTNVYSQFIINVGVDTVHNQINKDIISLFSQYFKVARNSALAKPFWKSDESRELVKFDLLKDIYSYTSAKDCTILGINKEENDIYRLRIMNSSIGTDGRKTVYFICDFIFYKYGNDYKIGNALNYNLKKYNYKVINTDKINYYFPLKAIVNKQNLNKANKLLKNAESFIGRKLEKKINYYTAFTCEELSNLRGFFYLPGSLSSVSKPCGVTDTENYYMFGDINGYHKHELLRSLLLLAPKSASILVDGLANLAGGSMDKTMLYHINKLYPYLNLHPELFENLDNFYYYDEETVPSFVFNAIVANYVLKIDGKSAMKKFLSDDSIQNISIQEFLLKEYHIKDLKTFFLNEMKEYVKFQKNLEYAGIFDGEL